MPDEIKKRPPSRLRTRLTELREGEEEDAQQLRTLVHPFLDYIPLEALPLVLGCAITIASIETWLEPYLGGWGRLASAVVFIAMVGIIMRARRRKEQQD